MGDLISRNALSEKARNYFISPDGALCLIESQPTAFDVERVIRQLEKNKDDAIKAIEENSPSEFHMIKIKDLKELFEEYTREQIEIVKKGGV